MSDSLPTLAHMLRNVNRAKLARSIGRPRGFVHRLAHGSPLWHNDLIPQLAAALCTDESILRKVVEQDRRAFTARNRDGAA